MNEMFVLEVEDDPFLEKPKRESVGVWGYPVLTHLRTSAKIMR